MRGVQKDRSKRKTSGGRRARKRDRQDGAKVRVKLEVRPEGLVSGNKRWPIRRVDTGKDRRLYTTGTQKSIKRPDDFEGQKYGECQETKEKTE